MRERVSTLLIAFAIRHRYSTWHMSRLPTCVDLHRLPNNFSRAPALSRLGDLFLYNCCCRALTRTVSLDEVVGVGTGMVSTKNHRRRSLEMLFPNSLPTSHKSLIWCSPWRATASSFPFLSENVLQKSCILLLKLIILPTCHGESQLEPSNNRHVGVLCFCFEGIA